MSNFKDHFSKQSDLYVKFRPHYPDALYAYLSSLTPQHELAWDCGTGNGQAANGLANFYDQIVATDPSDAQIKNGIPNKKINYRVEKAEYTSLESKRVDLITIANALHWFDLDLFYAEAKRVLKPRGIIAAWSYFLPIISPEVDKIIEHFHFKTLDDYWLAENRLVEKGYATIPFPFEEINSPPFFYEKVMTLDDLIGYLNTWSATQRFIKENKSNPTEQIRKDLSMVWGDVASVMKIRWAITLKVGRILPG